MAQGSSPTAGGEAPPGGALTGVAPPPGLRRSGEQVQAVLEDELENPFAAAAAGSSDIGPIQDAPAGLRGGFSFRYRGADRCYVAGSEPQDNPFQPEGPADQTFSQEVPVKKRTKIKSLEELPDDWWEEMPDEPVGYNCRSTGRVVGVPVEIMFDKGATRNSTTEELLVGMVNHCLAKGMDGAHPDWPILAFERRPGPPKTMEGINSQHPVPLVGNAVIRLELPEKGKESGPRVLIRLKVFRRGCCKWHGIFMGAPALECSPYGLGYRTVPDAHVLDALGIRMRRSEDMSCLQAGTSIFAELTDLSHVATELVMATELEPLASPFDVRSSEVSEESPGASQELTMAMGLEPMASPFDFPESEVGEDLLEASGEELYAELVAELEEPLWLVPRDQVWVPVRAEQFAWPCSTEGAPAVVPVGQTPISAVPGLWEEDAGMIQVVNAGNEDVWIERG